MSLDKFLLFFPKFSPFIQAIQSHNPICNTPEHTGRVVGLIICGDDFVTLITPNTNPKYCPVNCRCPFSSFIFEFEFRNCHHTLLS